MSRKLTILHFNVLEKYPPALNFISDGLELNQKLEISVLTSVNNSPYENRSFSGVKILRIGSTSKNKVLRYTSYLTYNFIGALILLLKRPDVVVVYETLSIFPAFVYSFVLPKKKIHIHYHEYVSITEKEVASKYMKVLFKCEEKLLEKYTCSQTNADRKELFLKDNAKLKMQNVFVFPNMPPKSWWKNFGRTKKHWDGGKIKLVYVGVLDADTMYLEELLKWVHQHPNELELTIFSQDVSLSAKKIISQFEFENIVLKSTIDYRELPHELIKYDIGLVLYKGHIPNYIYNVPNKVYEYLMCGLNVLVDENMISTKKITVKRIQMIDFKNLQASDFYNCIKSKNESNFGEDFEISLATMICV